MFLADGQSRSFPRNSMRPSDVLECAGSVFGSRLCTSRKYHEANHEYEVFEFPNTDGAAQINLFVRFFEVFASVYSSFKILPPSFQQWHVQLQVSCRSSPMSTYSPCTSNGERSSAGEPRMNPKILRPPVKIREGGGGESTGCLSSLYRAGLKSGP